jgi:hypothetical protein
LDLKDKFLDVFEVVEENVIETVYKTGFRDNLDDPTPYDFENKEKRPAILLLKFKKVNEYKSEGSKSKVADADTFNKLFNENKKLKKSNSKLKKENKELKEELKAFKNRKIVRLVDKIK